MNIFITSIVFIQSIIIDYRLHMFLPNFPKKEPLHKIMKILVCRGWVHTLLDTLIRKNMTIKMFDGL